MGTTDNNVHTVTDWFNFKSENIKEYVVIHVACNRVVLLTSSWTWTCPSKGMNMSSFNNVTFSFVGVCV